MLILSHLSCLVQATHNWHNVVPCVPRLFLYSDADVLIEPEVVEEFMTDQVSLCQRRLATA